ncbi:hypothetical protein BX666DRAFT_1863454 [Dichotomocladium elegans]|nr:hypothetical protein BX666DRAFT_1863454 [Dichotomocladium elegans]
MIYRLKTRLALANFKRQYGYEKYDLHTLESSLLLRCHQEHIRQYQLQNPFLKKKKDQMSVTRRLPMCPVSAKRSTSPRFPPKQRPPSKIAATAVHRFVHDHALPFSSDEEDAANLLVMLHNHA